MRIDMQFRALALAVLGSCSSAIDVPVIFGTLVGRRLSSGVDLWQGIPFATQSRFADPVDWTQPYPSGSRQALDPGPHCPQRHADDDEPSRPTSEDCLFLNVWRSPGVGRSGAPAAPVLVWFHGGGFNVGMGDEYDAEKLTLGRHIVVVTVNYRLGALGWLSAGPNLTNLGMKDQRSALRWVGREISNFGGDADSVMIFGESAGAISVALHLLSPGSAGLFRRALMESADLFANGYEIAFEMARDLAEGLGCHPGDLDCLRAQPLEAMLRVSQAVGPPFPHGEGYVPFVSRAWWPTIDGDLVPGEPMELFRAGRFLSGVDVLIGTNSDEGTIFVYPYHESMTDMAYHEWMRAILQAYSPRSEAEILRALEAYPPVNDSASNLALASRVMGDYAFTCHAREIARFIADGGGAVYVYHFDTRTTDNHNPAVEGVIHGADLPFVWESGFVLDNPVFTPDEHRLVRRMGDAWATFAGSGQPTVDKSGWPQYSGTSDTVAILRPISEGAEDGFDIQQGWRSSACNFWEGQWPLKTVQPTLV